MTDPVPMDERFLRDCRRWIDEGGIRLDVQRRLLDEIDSIRAQLAEAKIKYDADTATFMKSTYFIDYLKAQLAARDEAIGYVQRILERGEKNGGDRYVSEALAALRRAREGK